MRQGSRVAALLKTVNTGKAVIVKRRAVRQLGRYYSVAKKHGLQCRAQQVGKDVYLWYERQERS